jgi:hypothetical protein
MDLNRYLVPLDLSDISMRSEVKTTDYFGWAIYSMRK